MDKKQAEKSKTKSEEKSKALKETGTTDGPAGEKRAEMWDALKSAGLEKFFDVLVRHGWDEVANLSRLNGEQR